MNIKRFVLRKIVIVLSRLLSRVQKSLELEVLKNSPQGTVTGMGTSGLPVHKVTSTGVLCKKCSKPMMIFLLDGKKITNSKYPELVELCEDCLPEHVKQEIREAELYNPI